MLLLLQEGTVLVQLIFVIHAEIHKESGGWIVQTWVPLFTFLKGYRRFLQFCVCRTVRSIPHSSVFKVQTARINYGKMERVVKNEMKKNGKKNERGWKSP